MHHTSKDRIAMTSRSTRDGRGGRAAFGTSLPAD
ncbi:hypothetical protein BJ988_003525 [Nocardioides panzhihuensis]|uniref:Uncharacterized protein n=1 Tax=Nocardioides panzhihuensis TaxID=860243 RepID=A0A7Z0ITI2_9ACTN|nr:hypothetical protein [Nocardioides panzhihuensis]